MPQGQVDVRVGQCDPGKCFGDVPAFGLWCSQEFSPDGCVVKKVFDFDRCSLRHTTGHDFFSVATVDDQFKANVGGRCSAANYELADFSDRGQGFAAKTKCPNTKQLIRVFDFARRVTGYGEIKFIVGDTATIVADANQIDSTVFNADFDTVRTGIDAVFE